MLLLCVNLFTYSISAYAGYTFIQMFTSYLGTFHQSQTYQRLSSMIYPDSYELNEYNRICSKRLRLTVRTVVIIFATISFAYGSGFYTIFATGRDDTLFSSNFIGVAMESDTEYYVNVMLQLVYIIFFLMANISVEMLILLIVNAIQTNMLLAGAYLKKFGGDLNAGRLSAGTRKQRLPSILKETQCSNAWILEFTEYVYWRYFLSPLVITYSIGFCALCQYKVRLWLCLRKTLPVLSAFKSRPLTCRYITVWLSVWLWIGSFMLLSIVFLV